ncbi:carbohydrate ABC transporter permease [Geomicrobium sp. JSM 1781026]|uniref:carbohydrate ABC transporter permease n=1 Tax=Geomicrobium sp. JSM 1781026 TaxID=3344580 RepID=UPI0035BFEEEA
MKKGIVYTLLIIVSLLSIFPIYWMFVMATNPNHVINSIPPVLIPGPEVMTNFENVLSNIPFFRNLLNSFFVASTITIGVIFLCSLAGFAFAKLQFPGRRSLFLIVLATMMIPPVLGVIPLYYLITNFGWLNDYRALIFPGLINAFGIFWMRQYIYSAVHDEIVEAARIDGCSNWRMYWNIVIPMVYPAFATLGIIVFMQIWGDFMWPLIALQDTSMYTLQVALSVLESDRSRDYGMIMSGTFWATVPLIVVFLIFNRLFIRSITDGALKG